MFCCSRGKGHPQSPWVVTHQCSNLDVAVATQVCTQVQVCGETLQMRLKCTGRKRERSKHRQVLPLPASHHLRGEFRGAVVQGIFKSPLQQCFKHNKPMQLCMDRVRHLLANTTTLFLMQCVGQSSASCSHISRCFCSLLLFPLCLAKAAVAMNLTVHTVATAGP